MCVCVFVGRTGGEKLDTRLGGDRILLFSDNRNSFIWGAGVKASAGLRADRMRQ